MDDKSNTYYSASIAVAICGMDFCMLATDVKTKQNIIKVNDNILFGGVGNFWNDEEIYEPIKHRMNDRLSIVDAVELTEKYMYDNLAYVMTMKRNYFITGRDNDGIFYLIRVSLNEEEKSVQVISYVPKDKKQLANMIALPNSLNDIAYVSKYNSMLNMICRDSEYIPDVYLGCAKIIKEAAKDDTSQSISDKLSLLTLRTTEL